MTTRLHTALALAAILLAHGIAGRLDYDTERAIAAERTRPPAAVIVAEGRP